MLCGARKYVIEVEFNDKTKLETVTAKSPVDARKAIRKHYGKEATIISVQST